jgi:hypothetical protein
VKIFNLTSMTVRSQNSEGVFEYLQSLLLHQQIISMVTMAYSLKVIQFPLRF